ncbi:hypothetical protein H9624_11425 [Actinomycetaceae bacterium Sa1BUA1]|uniref:Amidase domain-containing protein n=2 Tax=Oceanitalea stevensii TaxID=2763072 RepID=A0ABR8Z3N0_9MICO|nr:hypothetical protein [Oceanitalea stevensii]
MTCLAVGTTGAAVAAPAPSPFHVDETTIADIHAAFADGTLSCVDLVGEYLARIAAYEDTGPAINSLVTVAPDALDQARALDAAYRDGDVGALHCIPVVLKDNVETADMPTTGGSKALAGDVPPEDAYITGRLREEGAIILGKGNMDEWAHGGQAGYSSVNGQTLNPYDPSRSIGGSSGGPAAAVAANFAVLSIGTDTLGSIRSPANAASLAAVKPTLGLVSGTGIIPFALTFDVAGPMTRTIRDSAEMLNVVAGVDPEDERTLAAAGNTPEDYTAFLREDALDGVRVGVLRTSVPNRETAVVDAALKEMEGLGAEIVDGIQAPESMRSLSGQYYTFISQTEFKTQLGEYLQARRPGAPVQSHAEVLAASEEEGFGMADAVLARLRTEATRGSMEDADYLEAVSEGPAAMRAEITALLEQNDVDVLVHSAGSGSDMASLSGFPSVIVPAGTGEAGVSVGMSFLGAAFTEGPLLGYAYAFEQATQHRQLPGTTPPLPRPVEPTEPTDPEDPPVQPGGPSSTTTGFFLNDGWGAVANRVFQYGRFGDEVLVGDWDGDGTDTITLRRGRDFFVNNRLAGGAAERVVTYGRPGDRIVVGDFDGDGVDGIAVRRGAGYHILNDLDAAGGPADEVVVYGRAGDQVVVGDWDGDGTDTLAVRRGATYFVKNSIASGSADALVVYGRAGDVTLAGDWDGDGTDTFAVRRGARYHVRNSISGGPADLVRAYGRTGDEVYTGDWNGDGRDTLGVRRAPSA